MSVVRRGRRVKAPGLDRVLGQLRAGEGATSGGSGANHLVRRWRGREGGKREAEPKKSSRLDFTDASREELEPLKIS